MEALSKDSPLSAELHQPLILLILLSNVSKVFLAWTLLRNVKQPNNMADSDSDSISLASSAASEQRPSYNVERILAEWDFGEDIRCESIQVQTKPYADRYWTWWNGKVILWSVVHGNPKRVFYSTIP